MKPIMSRLASWYGAPGLTTLVLSSTLTACHATSEVAQDDYRPDASAGLEDKYSVLSTLSDSILREYDKAAGQQGARIRYPVCVSAEFSVDDAARRAYLAIEQEAVKRWNDALKGAPGWRVENIELYMVGGAQPSSCPNTDAGMRVYKLVAMANQDRGYAEFYNFKNAIGRSEFNRRDVRRELHEYGHQLGLGDTYVEFGYQTPVGQPPGVMNLYFDVQTLTEDDITAVRHIWWMIRNNSNQTCADGYSKGDAPQNNNGHRFCVKTNEKPTDFDPSCADWNQHCSVWAAGGQCQSNPGYMLDQCKKSCRQCGGGTGGGNSGGTSGGASGGTSGCVDKNVSCASWAASGECKRNPGYMLPNCAKSCGQCGGGSSGGTSGGSSGSTGGGTVGSCRDSSSSCSSWARNGECTKNPGYMRTNCCASCKAGGASTGGTTGGGTSGGASGGTTGGTCRDSNQYCADWASNGECTKNPSYMRTNCCSSCKGR